MSSLIFLIAPLALSFFLVLILTPFWIRKAHQIGLVWDDMNKIGKQKVAGSGGVIVVLGFIIGILVFIGYRVFYLDSSEHLIEILALLVVTLMLSGIGLIDDLLGWQHGGLSRRSRIVLVAMAAIPLMAINAGKSIIELPLLGSVNVGILYPLILIPLGIIGTGTTFNFLAGFNGLEAGQGILILSASALVAYFSGSSWLSIIALCMVLSLLAFLLFNFYPSKVFPGDVITYPVGGLIAVLSILGNFEKVALFFFIPNIIEFILKARGRFLMQSFGKPKKNGALSLRYPKIYGLEHFCIYLMQNLGIKPTEKKTVFIIWSFQIFIIILGLIIFSRGIF